MYFPITFWIPFPIWLSVQKVSYIPLVMSERSCCSIFSFSNIATNKNPMSGMNFPHVYKWGTLVDGIFENLVLHAFTIYRAVLRHSQVPPAKQT